MKKRTKDEINRNTSPHSCFFVTGEGKLIKVNTPFMVKCIRTVSDYAPGDILKVTKVKTSLELKIIYIINDIPFSHSSFEPQIGH